MDDLKGLDWSKGSVPSSASPLYPTLRPTPSPSISGRSTPNNALQSSIGSKPNIKVSSKPGTPANDSFASLLSGPTKTTNNLSLQERQRLVLEEKARKAAEEQKQFDAHFGSNGLAGVNGVSSKPLAAAPLKNGSSGEADFLAGFGSAAPVNTATHFPPVAQSSMEFKDDDDDPFGLNEFAAKRTAPVAPLTKPNNNDDDDILGMLGRPADEVAAMMKPKVEEKSKPPMKEEYMSPEDKAVSSLVDMGFTPDQAAIALASTESGTDVQAAIGILLNQAHAKSKKKGDDERVDMDRRMMARDEEVPPWERSSSQNRGGKEKDVTQYASEIGTSLFKSANSLWKTGQRKVQKAVAEFANEAGDSNQPKWMRDAKMESEKSMNPFRPEKAPDMTDEALLLEGGGKPSLPSRPRPEAAPSKPFRPVEPSRSESKQAHRLTRQELEKTEPEVYVSPARRRKLQPQPSPQPVQEPVAPVPIRKSPLSSPPLASNNPFASVKTSARSSPSPQVRPKAPPRKIPPASDSALANSASQRQSGSDAYKRGDYTAAHDAYTRALQPLPSQHPVAIVVFCNRALTNIKVGDPKAAIADADQALEIIGVSRGEGEKIRLGVAEGEKDMKEFYGKALLRKAEALENMEKWSDAATVWKLAIEAGVGGSIAIQGRNRCEKAAGGASKPVAPRPPSKPKPVRSALDDMRPSIGHTASNEAVRKLREANAAAQKADDEKFALTDAVDAKLIIWKGTKSDNLRALLGSLDKVLWDGAGWNKVGMQDLVMPNRVKIIYMKAIAKVHPDKIPQDATTEQKMISAAVFATLNEAWDKFKTENGL